MSFAYSCLFAVFATAALGGDGLTCSAIALGTYGIIKAAELTLNPNARDFLCACLISAVGAFIIACVI